MKPLVLVLSVLFSLVFSAAQAQDLLPYYNQNSAGVWLDGYDPVAYKIQQKAVKGKAQFAIKYQGTTFYTSSAQHQELFKKQPAQYLPEYGGYCAYAIGSYNEKVEVDPETFQVKNGKVYLFYNKFFTNTLKSWEKDETKLRTAAEANWKTQKHKPAAM